MPCRNILPAGTRLSPRAPYKESMMARWWIRVGKKRYCHRGLAGRGEDVVKGLEEEVGVFALEHEGWPDLQHISGRAGRADQYPPFAHCLGNPARAPGCGCTGLLVD